MAKATTKTRSARTLNARRDTLDFRDKMYVPTLIEVPTHIPLSDFQAFPVPILDPGSEGVCTGFGLATVAHYLLARRKVSPDPTRVSPRMLYEMAKRYDEWPGEQYSGSSARGAMKGWHKHGLCSAQEWPYRPSDTDPRGLTEARTRDAVRRPLGAYFRVNHQDLVALHSAIAEVGVLYATAMVHDGWNQVGAAGRIPPTDRILGGHAFAIVAYDAEGLWLQNAWGPRWGKGGFACLSYDDWLAHGTDVWVARLGAPVTLRRSDAVAVPHSAGAGESEAYSYADLRPHIVSLGNDGKLKPGGPYGTSPDELRQRFEDDLPRAMADWGERKHLLLYAHGGLVPEETAVQRIADYRGPFLNAHVYPLAFIWHSGYWTTLTHILQDAIRRRRPEGPLDAAKDFLLNRLDDALEPLARQLTGKLVWDEMKENALGAAAASGGTRLGLDHLAPFLKQHPDVQLHIVGHSAGAILHAPLVRLLTRKGRISSGYLKGETGYGLTIASCTLWAPACTVELFQQAYAPAIDEQTIARFALFALTDQAEQDDDGAGIYHKSLLYLVSNAFEAKPRIPLFRDGEPLIGMAKFIQQDAALQKLFQKADLVLAPNPEPDGSPQGSGAHRHGDFDDDPRTVHATLSRILGAKAMPTALAKAPLAFQRSRSSLRDRRLRIDQTTPILAKP